MQVQVNEGTKSQRPQDILVFKAPMIDGECQMKLSRVKIQKLDEALKHLKVLVLHLSQVRVRPQHSIRFIPPSLVSMRSS